MTELRKLLQQPNSALLCGKDSWLSGAGSLLLSDPVRVLTTNDPSDVRGILEEAESELSAGRYVALCLSYEAAPAFELAAHPCRVSAPLVWLASFPSDHVLSVSENDLRPLVESPKLNGVDVRLNVKAEQYEAAVRRIKDLIAAGDTYQVNYTVHARFHLAADPLGYFLTLAFSHPVPFAAYLDLGGAQVLSLSPELLLKRRGEVLETRPMKGTRHRGRTLDEDDSLARELVASEKDRAENVMILDMMRNDLGKICRYGSVETTRMFSVEKYRSVWQMTSSVVGRLTPGVTIGEIMDAVFPGSSVTGAPKRRTMEIIHELELEPRGVYTGAIGLFAPTGDFTLSLPIRTLVHREGDYDLGVGSGIVWDSDPRSEYEETLLKAEFAFAMIPDLRLFETILLTESGAYAYLEQHLERMARSARYWDFPFDKTRAKDLLDNLARSGGRIPLAVRIELDQNGELRLLPREIPPPPAEPVRILLSAERTDSRDRFLFHKTNERKLYDRARREAAGMGFYEVIFRNEQGFLTEGAITNLFVQVAGEWLTPSVSGGLLPGVWREDFLRRTGAKEGSITVADLTSADEVIIGNSVRGAIPVAEICEGPNAQCVWRLRKGSGRL